MLELNELEVDEKGSMIMREWVFVKERKGREVQTERKNFLT